MRGEIRLLVAVVGFAGLAATACTTTQDGTGRPATKEPTSAAVTTTTDAPSTRPRELRLDGVDPCKVLTPDQMATLSVNRTSRNDSDIVKTGDVPTCEYSGVDTSRVNYGVGLVTTKGIEYWRGSGNVDVERFDIGGYPAVQLTLTGTDEFDCAVSLDVADGQQLYVDFSAIGAKPTQEQMCDNAKKAAELALATLPSLA